MKTTQATIAYHSAPLRGIVYILATVAFLSASDAATKWLAPHYAVVQIVFVRSVLGLVPALLLATWEKGRLGLTTEHFLVHVVRTGLMLTAWGLFIVAIRTLPLADAYTIAFGSPLFMALCGRMFLGERVTRARWLAVTVGFLGVLIALHPSGLGLGRPVLAAIGSAIAWALTTIISRRLSQIDRSSTILYYYMLLSLIATAPFAVHTWTSIVPTHVPIFLVAGTLGTAAHWFIAQAFRYGEVSLLAPFEYTGLVWAIVLGYWLWGDMPTPTVLAGATLIIGSGIYMARQEGHATKRRVPAKQKYEVASLTVEPKEGIVR